MKIYGHPWSINTRKTLLTFAEKGHEAELVTILLPKGEQKEPEHLARHPFGKVPVLDHDGLVLYETGAINRYLDEVLTGPALTPESIQERARLDQWLSVLDAYFVPHADALIVESLFRRYLGGPQNRAVIEAGRANIQAPLDAADSWLANNPYFAGRSFSLADIHWLPYLDYLMNIGEEDLVTRRQHLNAWWNRVSKRGTWQRVGRTGPQPYDAATAPQVENPAG